MSVEAITEVRQYLTFMLDDEMYALDIIRVHSVLDYERVTKVPKTPDFMRGVINLRGSVVPIVDLKLKFGLGRTEQSIDACVIIVEVDVDGEATVLGTLSDSVQEVVDIEPGEIEPPPKIGTRLDTDFIKGMARRGESFIIILDLERIFTLEELSLVQAVGEQKAEPGDDAPKAAKKKKAAAEA